MLVAWLLTPLLLLALAAGCGRLVQAVAGRPLPGALLVPVGMATVVVVAGLPIPFGDLGRFTPAIAVALAAAGWALVLRDRGPLRPDPWAVAAGLAAGLLHALPFLLAGDVTWGGYVKLDDTANWLALIDRALTEGRTLEGLAPSTYQLGLGLYAENGYPVGALVPLGIAGRLLDTELAWLYQPVTAFWAASMALALLAAVRPAIPRAPVAAAVAVAGSCSALLVGYAWWGGLKEVAGAALIALVVALVPWTLQSRPGIRAAVPIALAAGALTDVLSLGAGMWLLPLALASVAIALRERGWRDVVGWTVRIAPIAVAGAIPVLVDRSFVAATSAAMEDDALGNLTRGLRPAQVLGVWLTGEFREEPSELLVALGVVLVVGGLAAAVFVAARRGGSGVFLLMAGGIASAVMVVVLTAPWIEAKGLAMTSPLLLTAAAAGLAAAGPRLLAVPALALAACLLAGVVLQMREVALAPSDRMRELERIGRQVSGDGPLLITEYEPVAARWFLRDADSESASEYRPRLVDLRAGGYLPPGATADIEAFTREALAVYGTIVTRTGYAAGRPPGVFRLVSSGRYYDVWQRPPGPPPRIPEDLPLGTATDPGGVPDCDVVAELADTGDVIAAPVAEAPAVAALTDPVPPGWRGVPLGIEPDGEASAEVRLAVSGAGRWETWVGGSWRGRITVTVDGRRAGSRARETAHAGSATRVGAIDLRPGLHRVRVSYEPLLAGGHGPGFALTTVALARPRPSAPPRRVASADAETSLCGKRWDWLARAG